MCLQETTLNQAPAVATQLLNWFQQAVPGTATSSVNSCCSTSEDPCCSNIGFFFRVVANLMQTRWARSELPFA